MLGNLHRLKRFALAILFAPGLALAQAGNPRLASLNVEIWPEYDRAGTALVILKGELAQGVALPATLSLRLSAASGGPAAVAHSQGPNTGLLNLQYERQDAAGGIAIRFATPERFFHIELYEPLATALPARSYTYTWPGDLATDRLRVIVQEPATSSNIAVEPKLDLASTGQDGLRYLAGELGAREAGKPLPVVVRYTKLDLRTTTDIMKPKGSAAQAPVPAMPPSAAVPAAGAPFPVSVIVLLVVALLAIVASVAFLWWKRRAPRAVPAAGACTQCCTPRRPGDRFCGKCGAKLA